MITKHKSNDDNSGIKIDAVYFERRSSNTQSRGKYRETYIDSIINDKRIGIVSSFRKK